MPRVVIFDRTGDPDVLRIVDEPAAGEVRIKMEAIGLNRLDQMMREGTYPRPIHLPHARIGCEGTGTIDAVGEGVEEFRVGDAVIVTALPASDLNGTYADYTTVPAHAVIARPDSLDAVHSAALWVAGSTAYGALIEKAHMRPADHVLITAASSGVGLAAIQVANQIGAVPIAITRRATKRDALLAAGASAVIVTDEDDLQESVRRLTGSVGADIILDSVMGPGLSDLAQTARPGGTLVAVGWLDPRPAPFPMTGPLTIHRYVGFELLLDPDTTRRIAAFLSAGARSGTLQPTIDSVFTLDDIARAHRHLETGDQIGKIVVTV
ncbi:zinc-dependent alcohol dehydrogenase family protein [Rhodococcus artemisiae]|uniref:Zinc-dependent alcohol dehydrogenase family protein n=1 Tax=Rhodococcus artemisiae TaxID=714159 RepID=A0ABU7L744_9NOCA|nr:zinc-dependent alcohol dehydrogenase family protein [Rhodococcus artemisiae]MEE2057361.1 zinc-dependent alcohol dehydrogenase family protein [Rhodococcus artemisiae]